MQRQTRLEDADAILVRSAVMHEMELPEKLCSDRKSRSRCQ